MSGGPDKPGTPAASGATGNGGAPAPASGASSGTGDGMAMDAERDAYLREALRHAPDAGAGAPPALSDAILRQARQAVSAEATASSAQRAARGTTATRAASTRTRSTANRGGTVWSALWSWLMQPTVATGFASLMVATLVGVMWWGRPIDEPLTEARAPDVTAPANDTERPVASLRDAERDAPKPVIAAKSSNTEAQRPPSPPPAVSAATAPMARAAEDAETTRRLEPEKRTAALPELSSRTLGNPSAAPVDMPAAGDAAMPPPPVAMAPTAPAAPQATAAVPAPETPVLAAAAPARVAAAAGPSPAPVEAGAAADRARSQTTAEAAGSVASLAGSQAAESVTRQSLRAQAAPADSRVGIDSPVTRVRGAIAAWPEVWTWQRGSGPERAMNDAVRAWLDQLDVATGSRWQASPSAPGVGSARALRLLRNGRLYMTVRLEANAVRVDSTADPTSPPASASASTGTAVARAPLPGSGAASLRTTLDQAAP